MKHDSTHLPAEMPAKGFSPGFAALGLEAALLTTLDTLGYEEPTPIQREAILRYWRAAISWAKPQPEPARRQPLRCRCSNASPIRRGVVPPRLSWCRPESWPYRSAKPSHVMVKS